MGSISIKYDCGVPQISCTGCGNCESVMGKSLCGVADRGCCHYFPEFTLADIHRMVHCSGGLKALKIILGNPGTIINSYNLYAKGEFDREAYDRYVEGGRLVETSLLRDHTVFFRTCPFVRPSYGCVLPPRFRTAICNFFVCREILDRPDLQDGFKAYIEERSRYSRWIYRESAELQRLLSEKGISLVSDFDSALKLLAEIPPNLYEFPELPPVEY